MILFGKAKRKNHNSNLKESMYKIQPFSVNSLVLKCYKTGRVIDFRRLLYRGCPFKITNEYVPTYELMNREELARKLFSIFSEEGFSEYLHDNFNRFMSYIRWCEDKDITTYYDDESIIKYGEHLDFRVNKGEIKTGTAGNYRDALSFFLKKMEMPSKSRLLPSYGDNVDKQSHEAIPDNQFKLLGEVLFYVYRKYTYSFLNNVPLDICPFYEYAIESNYFPADNNKQKTDRKDKTKTPPYRNSKYKLINKMSACAAVITLMLTGLNATPLYVLRKKDIKFKKYTGDNYVIESLKARANYKEQENSIGFTKRSKEFIETWMKVAHQLNESPDGYAFPHYNKDGEVIRHGHASIGSPINVLHAELKIFGLDNINASRLRKTRSNNLMRILNDVVVVAEANNHSVNTAQKDYMHGIETLNKISIAGAFAAQADIAYGRNKLDALESAYYKFKDPLSDFDYKKLRKDEIPNKTPTGIRCGRPQGEKARKSMKKYSKLGTMDNQEICIDFLDCFECSDHVLIAEVDDIWLMLSFRDSIYESLTRISSNSKPTEKLTKIMVTVEKIIKRFSEVAPDNYHNAEQKNNENPHPLYSDAESIDDLIGVYS
jgi:integrase